MLIVDNSVENLPVYPENIHSDTVSYTQNAFFLLSFIIYLYFRH